MKSLIFTPSVFALFFTLSVGLNAQTEFKIHHACAFSAAATEGVLYTYDASEEAVGIVGGIMEACGLPQNFVVKSADCSNALATTEGKNRYILYSTAFLEDFKTKAETKWAAYSVLAHEIGHHLSNHDLETADPSLRKRQELEADRFAGNVLQKMGASLVQAQSGINTFALAGESTTHPKKQARLEALSVGWKKAEEQRSRGEGDNAAINSEEVKLYKEAVQIAITDRPKAIQLLDKALDINPKYTDALIRRAEYRWDEEDNAGAKADVNEAIFINKNAYEAYAIRGFMQVFARNMKPAFDDLDRAIRLNKDFADAYYYRAVAHQLSYLDDSYDKMMADFAKALQLNPKFYDAYDRRADVYYKHSDYKNAISDFTKALDNQPKINVSTLKRRAAAYFFDKQYAKSLADFDRAVLLEGKDDIAYITYSECLSQLGKNREAIAYLDKRIAKALATNDAYDLSGYFDAYLYRGIFKAKLNQNTEAEKDFQAALHTQERAGGTDYQRIGCTLNEYELYKLAIPFLKEAVDLQGENSPNSKACLEVALKKIKN